MASSPRLSRLGVELGDHGKRLRHALRHARPAPPGERDGVFNLDLHVAVIADARAQLESRAIPLTQWSVSGHTWVFDRERDPVAVVNERTYTRFGPRMVERFQRVYGRYLRSFRGFVATLLPCFSLLYQGFPGPTLAVCATRYEWPFTFNPQLWSWLNSAFRQGVEEGWLHLVANNRADADYVRNYTGLTPRYIPSACAYIAPTYSGRRSPVVVCCSSEELARSICHELEQEAIPLRSALGGRFSWYQLYEHRAIVFIPYNVSIMSLFEHYSACAPIYVPTREFLKRLMAEHPREVMSNLSYAQILGRPASAPSTGAVDLNDVRDPQVVGWYLDRADFYDREWMPRIRQFESWSHLDHLLATDDHIGISQQMAAEKPARLTRIAELWDGLEWLARVQGSADESGVA